MMINIDTLILFNEKLMKVVLKEGISLKEFNKLPQYKKLKWLYSFYFQAKNDNIYYIDTSLDNKLSFKEGTTKEGTTLKVCKTTIVSGFTHWFNFKENKFKEIVGAVKSPYVSNVYNAFGKAIEFKDIPYFSAPSPPIEGYTL